MIKFSELEISKEIKRAVEEIGYENATDIQEQAIPYILQGRDVLGRSNTGTGKTAAFGIPTIDKITPNKKHPEAIIICPTRELVTQVASELRKFAKYKEGIKIVSIYGGQSIDFQIKDLKRGCSIIVGTPGRIMDHMRRKTLKLDNMKMVILDEADEMLNMGFKEDIEEILHSMVNEYQMILFSATMPKAILKIAEDFQNDPITVEIKSGQRTIDTVEQVYFEIKKDRKVDALRILLNYYSPERTMIFCNTKKMVDDLVDSLNEYNIKAIGLHGDMKQMFRSRVMDQFKTGNYPILIATDVAARGIDVDNIDLVVNYDIPQDNEYYIHRIGRTGRAGKSGKAITLISGRKQRDFIKEIMRYTKTDIKKEDLPSSKSLQKASRDAFIDELKLKSIAEPNQEFLGMATSILDSGIEIEQLVSALISMNYKPEIFDVEALEDKGRDRERSRDRNRESRGSKDRGSRRGFATQAIKLSIGHEQGVKPGHIVCAIAEDADVDSGVIGQIDIQKDATYVHVAVEVANHVIDAMKQSKIKGKPVEVSIEHNAPKKEARYDAPKRDRGSRRGGDRDKDYGRSKSRPRNNDVRGQRTRNRAR